MKVNSVPHAQGTRATWIRISVEQLTIEEDSLKALHCLTRLHIKTTLDEDSQGIRSKAALNFETVREPLMVQSRSRGGVRNIHPVGSARSPGVGGSS
jgi:hypothetical protein